MAYVPDAGDVVWLDFDLSAGHEQRGHRPALVLSPASYNGKTGLAVVCPITSQTKGYPFEVAMPAGARVGGVVLSDQVRSVSWIARKARLASRVARPTLREVCARIGELIGIQSQ